MVTILNVYFVATFLHTVLLNEFYNFDLITHFEREFLLLFCCVLIFSFYFYVSSFLFLCDCHYQPM